MAVIFWVQEWLFDRKIWERMTLLHAWCKWFLYQFQKGWGWRLEDSRWLECVAVLAILRFYAVFSMSAQGLCEEWFTGQGRDRAGQPDFRPPGATWVDVDMCVCLVLLRPPFPTPLPNTACLSDRQGEELSIKSGQEEENENLRKGRAGLRLKQCELNSGVPAAADGAETVHQEGWSAEVLRGAVTPFLTLATREKCVG